MKFYPSLAVVAMLLGSTAVAHAQTLPSYMAPIAGHVTATPADIATKDMLALNTGMFELYGDAGKIFQANILANHPVILGLFSGAGGRFTLYLDNADNKSWRGSMLAYRSRMQSALDGLDATPIQPEWRDNNRTILQNNIAFMDDCVAKGAIAFASLEAFSKKQAPYLAKNVTWSAQTQVNHWMTVLAGWKTMLGPDWDKTYAASNTIYVARQNNVLFSVLAQFFPPDAINDRLLLIETVSFTTTQSDMLDSLTRIIADRSVGSLFFGNYHLMDYELMGGDARTAIVAEAGKHGMTPFLPPVVPFGSHQWPTLITPGAGPASIADLK
jgi:hypothetical protein